MQIFIIQIIYTRTKTIHVQKTFSRLKYHKEIAFTDVHVHTRTIVCLIIITQRRD